MNVVLTIAGIALPSLLLTLAVRRWLAPVEWRFAALFLAMTFAFLHGAVFTDALPVPVDETVRGYPYRALVGPVEAKNPLTNDTVNLFLPWMKVAREELFAFRAPLWNRYSFGGYPLLANGESAPFSPLFLATLFVPLPKQIVAMAGLKIFVALLFGFLFARREGASDAASCFAAVAFAFSVFQTVYLYYTVSAVTSFLPAALFVLTGAKRRLVAIVLVVATLMANGHPESVLHIAIACGGVLLIDLALRRETLRDLGVSVAASALGLALSAPTWVPVLEQVRLSARLAELRAAGSHFVPFPLTAAWAMVNANGFGNPVRHNYAWFINYTNNASSYVGLIVLALVATAAVSRRTSARERLWLLLAVLFWLIAMGWLPLLPLVANEKLRFASLFLGAVVAARTLDRLREERGLALYGFAALFGALGLYVFVAKRAILRPVDLAGVVALAALLVVPRLQRVRVAFVLLALELFLLNNGFNALVDAKYYELKPPILDALRAAAPAEPFRIAGLEWTFLPNASARYGFEDIRGSDPMAFASYVAALRPVTIDDPRMDLDRVVNANHPLLDRLGVRFLLTDPGVEPGGRWRGIYRGADGSLFENRSALGRFFIVSGDGDVTTRQLTPMRLSLRVTARSPVVLGSSQSAAAGWSIRESGRRLWAQPYEQIFLGAALAPGSHTLDVVYRPMSYWRSVYVALAALIFLVFCPFFARGIRPTP